MKKKKIFIFCSVIFLLSLNAYYHRNAYITQYTWKQTSNNGTIGNGIVCIGDSSNYTYQWPMIKKDENNVGIVLLCIGRRMIVFSLQNKELGFYVNI